MPHLTDIEELRAFREWPFTYVSLSRSRASSLCRLRTCLATIGVRVQAREKKYLLSRGRIERRHSFASRMLCRRPSTHFTVVESLLHPVHRSQVIGGNMFVIQVVHGKEFIIPFTNYPFSKKRECMTVLYAVGYYRQYLKDPYFTLVTHCSVHTCLFAV